MWIFLGILTLVAFVYALERYGRRLQEGENAKQELEDMRRVRDARDRMDRDRGFAARVRARFTRKVL